MRVNKAPKAERWYTAPRSGPYEYRPCSRMTPCSLWPIGLRRQSGPCGNGSGVPQPVPLTAHIADYCRRTWTSSKIITWHDPARLLGFALTVGSDNFDDGTG